MAGKTKQVSKSEAARRKSQSSRDKKGTTSSKQNYAPKAVVPTKSKKKKSNSAGGNAYAKLVLDPCMALQTQSNMPGNTNTQVVRLPYRQVVYIPTAGVGTNGAAASGMPSCDTIMAILTPHSMVAGGGTFAGIIQGAVNESTAPISTGNTSFDPQGLSGLASYVGEMRPISACVRISCMATDTANSGLFYGYEGTAKQYITHYTPTDYTSGFVSNVTAQNIILSGGQTSGATFSAFEARINYPNADPEWQEMRNMTSTTAQGGTSGSVTRSGDGSDPDFSEMPIAIVGVTSATPGARYLIDGAIVYEWAPKLTIGIAAPQEKPANKVALATSAKAVEAVASKMGGMLVGAVSGFASGGSAGAALGLIRAAYAK